MGIDCSASLGYGFKIDDNDLMDEFNSEERELSKEFELTFGGDAYGDNGYMIICIKKSVKDNSQYEKPTVIKNDFFTIQSDWDEKLLNLAKELKVKKPKIGWYLTASMS